MSKFIVYTLQNEILIIFTPLLQLEYSLRKGVNRSIYKGSFGALMLQ